MRRVWIVVAMALGAVGIMAARLQVHATGTSRPAVATNPIGTVVVARRDMVSTRALSGALASDPAVAPVDRLTGTYTALPAPGTLIGPGSIAWEIDGEPVVVMSGPRPAWRPFALGMVDGPDVTQLEAGLIAAGFAHGLISTPAPHFGAGAQAAVKRWQAAVGLPVTGAIELGRILFLPQLVLVAAHRADPGDVAEPGSAPYDVTGTGRTAVAAVDPADPTPAVAGEPLSVELPDGSKVEGHVLSIDPISSGAQSSGDLQSSSGSAGTSGSSGPSGAGSQLALTARVDGNSLGNLTDGSPVSILVTVGDHRDTLAVPVDALVAMSADRSGVELATGGRHVFRPVRTGVFAGGYVEITSGLAAGDRVVVPG
jgi:peptidoglycan hydrolase-like protein with peptidoglycan-binding domain